MAAKQICCISVEEFEKHVKRRQKAFGLPEDQYQILVTVPKNKSFRVYVNVPHKKHLSLRQQTVSRNRFPAVLFKNDSSD